MQVHRAVQFQQCLDQPKRGGKKPKVRYKAEAKGNSPALATMQQ